MHTSSVSYHRIVFTNINDYPSLQELAIVLDLQGTDHPDIFDLVQDEGCSLSVQEAISLLGEAYDLDLECDKLNGESPDFAKVLASLREKARELAYIPHTRILEDSYHNPVIETDINPDELYDLLVIIAGPYFTVDNITTQWSMSSNKAVAGAHAGGSEIVTREFRLPIVMTCDEMETVTNEFRKRDKRGMAEYYIEQFIKPLISDISIKDTEFRRAVTQHLIDHCTRELAVEK